MVESKRKAESKKTKANNFLKIIGFVAFLILINIVAQHFYTRFDFTKEKRFTLTQKTKDVLNQTKKDVIITVFLDGEMPAAFKRLRNATRDLLNDYKATADVNVKVIFVDPLKDKVVRDQDEVIAQLAEIGINPMAVNIKSDAGITQKIIFPMALVESDEKPIAVNLLSRTGGAATDYEQKITSSIQDLEYVFTSAIKRLQTGYNPNIGFTEGHGEPSNQQLYDAIVSLSSNYYVTRVDLNLANKEGLDNLDVMIVAKPQKALTELEKYKINYFVMKGGRLVWAIDQVNANLDQLQQQPQIMANNYDLNLNDMLFEYGARVNYNLITDVNSAMIPIATGAGQQAQIDVAPWFYFPILLPDTSNLVVKNIDGVKAEFASTVDTIGVANV
ncbi:MAG: gliding motility-associated ABC transporter substrate-binding protein GldG, partial [Flavobacterium sp.]